MVKCWFEPFGCNHLCLKYAITDHLTSNMKFHFDLVIKSFDTLQQTIRQYQEEIKKLNLENETLKVGLQLKEEKHEEIIQILRSQLDVERLQKEKLDNDLLKHMEIINSLKKSIINLKLYQTEKDNELKNKFNEMRYTKRKFCTTKRSIKKKEYISIDLSISLNAHNDYVYGIDYTTFDDNQFICSGSADKKVCVFDVNNDKYNAYFDLHLGPVYCVKFSQYHYNKNKLNIVCSSSRDNTIRFWDFKNNAQIGILKNDHSLCGIEFSSFNHGKYLCSGSFDNTIRIWDVETLNPLCVLSGHDDVVWCIAISPSNSNAGLVGGNGYTICSGSYDGTIRTWDIDTHKQLNVLTGHERGIRSVKYGRNNMQNTVLSGSSDRTVRLWDIRSNEQVQRFDGHKNIVWSVEYIISTINIIKCSNNLNLVCSGSEDDTIKIWDTRSNKNPLYTINNFEKERNGITSIKLVQSDNKKQLIHNCNFGLICGSVSGKVFFYGEQSSNK
ncbi:WD-40 repeat protein [Reticulomyxa filosa]|uniref:WD-40 repeat protein n=1 Tax=Reticulomyxa filosa TaxID=46433 RepID=X6PDW2_RETFI|nr:WD-40 repeat protein [Reticulomyxa filosa]|eukprot:ETO36366.1 WD-40 repeat protein [Reticulomyxa filosa]